MRPRWLAGSFCPYKGQQPLPSAVLGSVPDYTLVLMASARRQACVYYPLIFPLFYLRHKLYCALKNTPCELLEFSPHGILIYFSFSRISSAVIPDVSSFFSIASASTFLAASAAFASSVAFLASSFAISFSVCSISAFCGFSPSRRELMSVFSFSI